MNTSRACRTRAVARRQSCCCGPTPASAHHQLVSTSRRIWACFRFCILLTAAALHHRMLQSPCRRRLRLRLRYWCQPGIMVVRGCQALGTRFRRLRRLAMRLLNALRVLERKSKSDAPATVCCMNRQSPGRPPWHHQHRYHETSASSSSPS